jgi:hypothetical protein
MTEELCCRECHAAVSKSDRFCTECGIALAMPPDELHRAGPQEPVADAVAIAASSLPNAGSARPAKPWFHMEAGHPQPSGGSGRNGKRPPAERDADEMSAIKDPRHRYAALRLIADLNTVIGYLILIGGTVGVIIDVHYAGKYALLGLVAVGLAAIGFFFWAALIRLMISLEENTRRTAELMVIQVTEGDRARSRLNAQDHDTPVLLT